MLPVDVQSPKRGLTWLLPDKLMSKKFAEGTDLLTGCMQMQGLLQDGLHKLEQHPHHQEDVPDQQQVAQLSSTAQKLVQLKEAGNRYDTLLGVQNGGKGEGAMVIGRQCRRGVGGRQR